MAIHLAKWLGIGVLTLGVAGCGGGGGGGSGGSTVATQQPPSASVSMGAITAFGSVVGNVHEFATGHTTGTDDDTGATLDTSSLEVGMVVTVKPSAQSTDEAQDAAEIHVSPLAQGFVDASDTTAGTLMVMGQTVQLATGTLFNDHRACTTAATPCTPVTGQSGLTVNSGGLPGSFVTIQGYLFSPGTGGAQIVATLVSVRDYTAAGTSPSLFKLEGQVTSANTTVPAVTVGAESIDLSQAVCQSGGQIVACAAAFHVGDVVAARGTTAPTGSVFAAQAARLVRLLPQTAGATVELEGKVASVSGSTFVMRGITIDGSALTSDQIPAVGDKVEVVGTVSSDGLSIKAIRIEDEERVASAHVVLAGPLSSVTAGAQTDTFNVVVLGQTATVTAATRIADLSTLQRTSFNIHNFQSYLQGKAAYVVVTTNVDSTGALRATGFVIVPAPRSGLVGIAGAADAAPVAGMNGTSTVTVHGVTIIFTSATATVAKGNFLVAKGSLTAAGAIDTTVPNGRLLVFQLSDHDFDFDFDK